MTKAEALQASDCNPQPGGLHSQHSSAVLCVWDDPTGF